MRRHHLLLTALWLAAGVIIVLYTGPGRVFIRGALGDVMVVPFLVHLLGIAAPRRHGLRIAGVGLLAVGVEFLQLASLVQPSSPQWMHLTLGSTFDPWDLLGYSVGMGIAALTAVGLERSWRMR